MIPEGPPSAEGTLEKTPFSHLLVYALDRQLTGELFLQEASGTVHALRLDLGAPIKARVSDSFLRLGDLVVLAELCPRETVEGAALTGGLLGDVLVLGGCADTDAIDLLLEEQFHGRIQRCFELGPDTTFRYFDKSQTLAEWGGEPSREDPIALVWRGLKEHAHKSSSYETTLARLAGRPLQMHARAPVSRLRLEPNEAALVDRLGEPTTLADLLAIEGVDAEVCRRLVYALVILCQLDLGGATAPVGVRDQRPASLAKVQLRSTSHRVGAAVDAWPAASTRSITVSGRKVIPRDDTPASEPPPSELPISEVSPPTPLESQAFDPSDVGVIETGEVELDPELLEEEVSEAAPVEQAAAASPAEPAPKPEDEAEETSSRRIVPETLRAMTVAGLKSLAEEKLKSREAALAVQACEAAQAKLQLEGDASSQLYHEVKALLARGLALEPHSDLKSLSIELDELIRARDDLAITRCVRGSLRRRLGDSNGASSDYRRVLELPDASGELHTEAKRELEELSPKLTGRGQTGFLKRLFKR
jgi:hypothetical protein